MAATMTSLGGKGTFERGIHPSEQKSFAEHVSIEVAPTPERVRIPLLQHTGAPCTLAVKPRQDVVLGDVIGATDAFISAPVHATINGKVERGSSATLPNGRRVETVPIKADGDQLEGEALWNHLFGGDWPKAGLDAHNPEGIVKAVREAGIVGLGGAAFPTHVKLMYNEKKPIDVLLLNGCECEPYLTADDRLMSELPDPIITGALLAGHATRAPRVVIVIEDNKPVAADAMRKAAEGTGIEVCVVSTKYPMGGERQLIPAVLGREVPTGGLPLDVGVVVMNVGTAASVARAVLRDQPLTHRIVTLTGAGIKEPKNLLVPIGMSYADLIECGGGLTDDAARAIAGGPMMGSAIGDLEAPITKGTSGLTILTHDDLRRARETACIRCGRCVDVCPLNLVPTKLAEAARHRDWDLARRYHLAACCDCGCCAYTCPANLPLVQLIRTAKTTMPRN